MERRPFAYEECLVAPAALLAVAAAAVSFTQPVSAQDNMLDTIKKRGKLQVGFATFVPWAMRDKVDVVHRADNQLELKWAKVN